MKPTLPMAAACMTIMSILPGCMHGPRVEAFAPAGSGAGVETDVRLVSGNQGQNLRGELLAVRPLGIVLLTSYNQIVFVRYDQTESARFKDLPALQIGARRTPVANKQASLRLFSRYPQGLDGEVLEALLEAHNQDEVLTFE